MLRYIVFLFFCLSFLSVFGDDIGIPELEIAVEPSRGLSLEETPADIEMSPHSSSRSHETNSPSDNSKTSFNTSPTLTMSETAVDEGGGLMMGEEEEISEWGVYKNKDYPSPVDNAIHESLRIQKEEEKEKREKEKSRKRRKSLEEACCGCIIA